jgi:phosphopentomutase
MRAFLVVLDSVGIGAAPDAADYGDEGANTLANTARAVGGLRTPTLTAFGLGNIPEQTTGGPAIAGVPSVERPLASFGAMRERSRGKDTTTGHWEMAGLELTEGFRTFPMTGPAFPPALLDEFTRLTGRAVVGNHAASGTRIVEELGPRQMVTGEWIVYSSADSVFQVAAHEGTIPLAELYAACETARDLANPYRIGRVIARPFVGEPGHFRRTENRRDYSYPLPEETVLDRLLAAGMPVVTVGKLDDVFNHRGMTRAIHVENNRDAQRATLDLLAEGCAGLTFVNLIDFDMLYGHRRDAAGYARCLAEADAFLGRLAGRLGDGDLLLVTADHGNDPTFRGTDHTREYVPLLAFRRGGVGRSLGVRDGFFDVAQTLARFFDIAPMPRGASFLSDV